MDKKYSFKCFVNNDYYVAVTAITYDNLRQNIYIGSNDGGLYGHPNDFKKIMRPDIRLEINQTFKQMGFAFITLDMQGYRSGSMDEGIM